MPLASSGTDSKEPFTAFNFAVEINVPGIAPRLCSAAFAECEGLGLVMEIRSIREGGNNADRFHLLGPRAYGHVTLRRGMTSDFHLWEWIDAFLPGDTGHVREDLRADAEVVVFAPDGITERVRFLLKRCLPIRLNAPALNAREGAVAIEELQLAYESLILRRPGMGPAVLADPIVRAELRQLSSDFKEEINPERSVTVQFNPETLKVSYANSLMPPSNPPGKGDAAAAQFVGAGMSKLVVHLWFDITSPLGGGEKGIDDVRRLTGKVAYFITPDRTGAKPERFVPRPVRFVWGSFQFDGIMDSIEETLELFSGDGRPLRSNLSIVISRHEIRAYEFARTGTQKARAVGRRRGR